MIAITPGGWYDWENKNMLAGTSKLEDERPLVDRAREAGMGLIGMKAVRYFSSGFFGTSNTGAFDEFYGEKLLQAKLTAYQRSYAFVLENGLDCLTADIHNLAQLKENFIASATSHEYGATA